MVNRGTIVPADGEEFELRLRFPVDPLEMVSIDGYSPTQDWEFTGQQIVVPQTRRFKLVRVGYYEDFDEVLGKLAQYGDAPEGQWREAFRRVYPRNDGNGPIGFPDSSWVRPGGDATFPVLIGDGERWSSYFYWGVLNRTQHWRWLVAVAK